MLDNLTPHTTEHGASFAFIEPAYPELWVPEI